MCTLYPISGKWISSLTSRVIFGRKLWLQLVYLEGHFSKIFLLSQSLGKPTKIIFNEIDFNFFIPRGAIIVET